MDPKKLTEPKIQKLVEQIAITLETSGVYTLTTENPVNEMVDAVADTLELIFHLNQVMGEGFQLKTHLKAAVYLGMQAERQGWHYDFIPDADMENET